MTKTGSDVLISLLSDKEVLAHTFCNDRGLAIDRLVKMAQKGLDVSLRYCGLTRQGKERWAIRENR